MVGHSERRQEGQTILGFDLRDCIVDCAQSGGFRIGEASLHMP